MPKLNFHHALLYKHVNKVDPVKRIDEKNTIVLDEENVPTIDFEELSDGPDGDENISRSNFN